MLDEFGGQRGLMMYAENGFNSIMEEVKQLDSIWDKVAHMLDRLRFSRLVDDGQERTSYIVTKTFLETNGYEMAEKKESNIITFLRYGIKDFDEKQINEWLKDGEI